MIEIRRITNWDSASDYHEAWNSLVINSSQKNHSKPSENPPVPTIFQTFEWNQTWWQSFGDADHELLLLYAFEEQQLVGIAPLMIKKIKSPFAIKVIYFIGASDSNWAADYCSFISAVRRDEVTNAFFQWLDLHPECWDELEFKNVPEYSNDLNLLKKKFAGQYSLQFLHDAPSRFLSEADEITHLTQLFSNRRSKTKLNNLKRMGVISYNCSDCDQEIHSKLDGFFQQHIERRSQTPQPSFFNNESYKKFYRKLVETLSPKGWVQLFTTELNEEAIAHCLTFRFQDTLYMYTPSFDINFMKYSPGDLQFNSLFEYALKQNLKEVTFGAGGESYKYRFSNNIIKLYSFRTFRSWPRYALFKVDDICRRIVRHIRKPFRKDR